ncbi:MULTISPECIES: nucleotidyl transferase AbiEii/AbiGii toxin family protein [unclassified Stenotrophomonas]|uniref:nucleotidyl transferase AbiEii/AbiGii toxin family protein n=1 Tax=unclassified Stenotrophomonas TaxID=196198 RepID=UPI00244B6789|nr:MULTISPECIES: nucleotidyl transferase AbiEii/AbiGii toxin family protein [unclassified Stenotrophomonas]MBN5161650.1 nucleotidyl transferase AbiEii/AbiGii toxin family protein [Stenotrophomonas maltophilia]MDG9844322.1 nucleotidyl transferase AbiEii/AbiGii toxin family protein [Stenotrophomonas sp. GD04054]MDH0018697.1 nucleotidyl transferase AbiEii/AbiGii toxin family protein [Stenotrophomonas sp. GD04028]MDH0576336.1 nucleotidyl transferase AbiEii/AbiGii toxin family protein [Stenotrophomo
MIPSPTPPHRVASIRQRLLDLARKRGEDFQFVLDRFAVERLLYRLSASRYRNQFLLKGAMLFAVWFDAPHCPTRDADFLGSGSAEPDRLLHIALSLCGMPGDDGLRFDPGSIVIEAIREEATYEGLRMRLIAHLGRARCHVQWDVGFGDAVITPPPEITYPVILEGFPPACLRVYPRETVFAEKLEAIAALGIANSRMKDFFDLLALIREDAMDRPHLVAAIGATFDRRRTRAPTPLPYGLTQSFAADPQKQTQWRAFLRRNRLIAPDLSSVIAEIADYLDTLDTPVQS